MQVVFGSGLSSVVHFSIILILEVYSDGQTKNEITFLKNKGLRAALDRINTITEDDLHS